MLQMFYLDVSIADRVMHLPPRLLLPRVSVSPPLLDDGDVRATWAHVWMGGVGGVSRSSGV